MTGRIDLKKIICVAVGAIAFVPGILAESGSPSNGIHQTKTRKEAIFYGAKLEISPFEDVLPSLDKLVGLYDKTKPIEEKPVANSISIEKHRPKTIYPVDPKAKFAKFGLTKSGEIPIPPSMPPENDEPESEDVDPELASPDEPLLDFEGGTSPPDEEDTQFPLYDPITPPPVVTTEACEAAVPVSMGDTITGTTVDAPPAAPLSCGTGTTGGSGVFYTLAGTGDGIIVSFLASFEILVHVYSGRNCESLVCVTSGYGVSDPDTQSKTGTVSWASQVDETYYIVPHHFYDTGGDFEFTVTAGGETPENGECANAIAVESGVPVQGSTSFGIISSEDSCAITPSAPGVWYAIKGTGELFMIALVDADYDSRISLFEGDSCDSLTCVRTNDDTSEDWGLDSIVNSGLVEYLEDGQTYYILVDGFSTNFGDFTLIAEPMGNDAAPENDNCADALPLSVEKTILGSTVLATPDEDLPDCGMGITESMAGVFFSIVGTGGYLTVSTNLLVSIYDGDCDALECIQTAPNFATPVGFDSVLDKQYLVHVYGSRAAFNITLEEIEALPNDNCGGATALTIDGDGVPGDTSASIVETGLEVCGGLTLGLMGGLWYTFQGNGQQLLLGVKAAYDAQLVLYTGSCDMLECLAGNDDSSFPDQYQSSLEFDSVDGATYFALVHGYYTSAGTFEIELLQWDTPEDNLTVTNLPDNDDCDGAVEIIIGGPSMSGDTSSATSDAAAGLEICGASSGLVAGGLWFRLTGNGKRLFLGVNATFDSQLLLYGGNDCDNLECIDGNDDTPDPIYQSGIQFESVDGQTYYGLVHGFSSSAGPFGISLTQLTPDTIANNDGCDNSLSLIIGGPAVEGDTAQSTEEIGLATCGSGNALGTSGLWYSFVGTGERLVVGVRTSEVSYDSQLLVYQGDSCQDLMCVDSNDDSILPDYESAVAFNSIAGSTYYALVHGLFTSTGTFEIEVTALESLNNDFCEDSVSLEIGVPVSGDTSSSLEELGLSTCGSGSGLGAGGLWYTFEGSGSRLLIGVNASFDSQLWLYSGTCENLLCVDGNDDYDPSQGYQSALELDSVQGETYFALVHGYFTSVGNFEIVLLEALADDNVVDDEVDNEFDNENDSAACENATSLVIGGKLGGNTANSAVEDIVDVCGGVSSLGSGGIWYQIVGDGGQLLLGVSANFDSQLLLYSGSCGTLECIDGNDDTFDHPEYQSAMEFSSNAGETYYALVHGFALSVGDFEIELTTAEPQTDLPPSPSPEPPLNNVTGPVSINDECVNAIALVVGQPVFGDTSTSVNDRGVDVCGTSLSLGEVGGLWYSFVGNGEMLLLGVNSTFDSQLLLYSGICGALECVDGSDDSSIYDSLGFQTALEVNAILGQIYHVLVHGFLTASGPFTIELTHQLLNVTVNHTIPIPV